MIDPIETTWPDSNTFWRDKRVKSALHYS